MNAKVTTIFDTKRAASVGNGSPASVGATSARVATEAEQAALQLIDDIDDLIDLELPFDERFGRIEALARPMSLVIPELVKQYGGGVYPLPEASRRFAVLVSKLLVRFGLLFQGVVREEKQQGWLLRRRHQTIWYKSRHHLVRCYGFLLRNYQFLEKGTPKGIWAHLHNIYNDSVAQEWQAKPVRLCSDSAITSSIEQEYLGSILISRLDLRRLNARNLGQICATLQTWTAACRTVPASGAWTASPGTLYIDIRHDAPPRPLPEDESGIDPRGLIIETASLEYRLRNYLELVELREYGCVKVGGHTVDRETLQLLYTAWGRRWRRTESREVPAQDKFAEVRFGLSNAHTGLRHCVVDAIDRQRGRQALSLDLEQGEYYAVRHFIPDVWSRIYGTAEARRRRSAVEEPTNSASSLGAEIVDESRGGCSLLFPADIAGGLRVGELAVVKADGEGAWRVGEILWVRPYDERRLIAAVQFRITEALGVDLYVQNGHRTSDLLPSLVGVDSTGNPVIALPQLPGIDDKRLVLAYQCNESRIALERRVSSSGAVHFYHFDSPSFRPLRGAATPLDASALRAVLSGLRHGARPPAEGREISLQLEDEDFSGAWAVLA